MTGIDSNINMPPDPEIVMRTWLLSRTTITDEVDQKVSTKLPQNPSLPFIVIENQGSALASDSSQAPINICTMGIFVYAGKYGGDGTKAEPDYATASRISNIIYKELFRAGRTEVISVGGVNAVVYGFGVGLAPTRLENRERQIAEYEMIVDMTYRYTE
jgi:hypothetical protein